jgi:hypothetical protein
MFRRKYLFYFYVFIIIAIYSKEDFLIGNINEFVFPATFFASGIKQFYIIFAKNKSNICCLEIDV